MRKRCCCRGRLAGGGRGGREGRVTERTADDNYNRASVRTCCTLLLSSVWARVLQLCVRVCVCVGKRWIFRVSPVYFIPAASPLSSWLGERRFKLNLVQPVLFFCFFFTGLLTWQPPPLRTALTQITEHPGQRWGDARSTRCISGRIWIDNVIYRVPRLSASLPGTLFSLSCSLIYSEWQGGCEVGRGNSSSHPGCPSWICFTP